MDNPYPNCENCIFVDEPLDKDPCQECNRAFLAQRIKPNFVSKRKPKTNADRIRSMTDEELAKFISGKARTFGEEYEGYMSALDWLEQEVET